MAGICAALHNRAVMAGYDMLNEPCSNNETGDYPCNIYSNYKPNWDRMNSLYRRVVPEIRKIDSRHIIFLEGDNYANRSRDSTSPSTTTSPTVRITTPCPASDPANIPARSTLAPLRRMAPRPGICKRQERSFLDAEGTRFTQQHNVPLWVGEFGSVYNGPAEENGDRLRALDDQIGIFEQERGALDNVELQGHWRDGYAHTGPRVSLHGAHRRSASQEARSRHRRLDVVATANAGQGRDGTACRARSVKWWAMRKWMRASMHDA